MSDAPAHIPKGGSEPTHGPARRSLVVAVYAALGVGVIVGIILGLSYLSATVSSTLVRFIVAIAGGIFIARFLWGYFRQATQPLPPDPEPEAVPREIVLTYVCSVCGLELEVRTLAKDKAPKHCGEDMKLYVEG